MKIETERLIIRTFRLDDYHSLFEMCSDKDTARLAGWRPHKDLKTSKNIVFGYVYNNETYAIILKDENKLIGTISLYKEGIRKNINTRELGFCLNKKYRDNKYMKEAVNAILYYGFNKLNLDIIYAYTMIENIASQKILEHSGLKYEGTLRKFRKLYTEEVIDVMMYSIIKEEFI